MNSKALKLAVGATLALAATTASAVDFDTVPSANILYIAGATATDAALTNFATLDPATSALCDSAQGPISRYQTTTGATRGIVVACFASAWTGIAANTRIAIVKETISGSAGGIRPVADNTSQNFLDPTALIGCNYPAPVAVAGLQAVRTVVDNSCGAPTTLRAPNMGVSDVEAALFQQSEAGLTSARGAHIMFAPAVSVGLYRALQHAQGLTQIDDVANIPSLSFEQLRALYTGRVTSWATVRNAANTPLTTGTWTWGDGTTNAVNPLSTPSVYLCRRGQRSGTQRTFAAFFTNANCAAEVQDFRTPTSSGTLDAGQAWGAVAFGDLVFAGGGTGDVLGCMHYHDSVRRFAIGILSVESFWGAAQTNASRRNWRYIAIDGVAPELRNLVNNTYPLYAQSVLYRPATAQANTAAGTAALIQDALFGSWYSVATIVQNNQANQFTLPSIDGGLLAIPGPLAINPPHPTFPVTVASVRANPVNSTNRQTAGGVTNNCAPPMLRFGGAGIN